MAKKLGLDLQTFFDISSKASGQCWSMTSYCPVPGVGPETPADRDYEGGFAAALMLKDLRLAMEAAQSVDAYTPMGAEAETLYARFAEALGGGGKDFSGDHQDDRRQLDAARQPGLVAAGRLLRRGRAGRAEPILAVSGMPIIVASGTERSRMMQRRGSAAARRSASGRPDGWRCERM